MGFDEIIQGIFALFIIIIFLTIVIPALGEATGADMTFGIIAFIILAIGALVLIFASIIKR